MTAELHNQSVKLQWFKELIIQPHINYVYTFYSNIDSIKEKLKNRLLTEDEIISVNTYIKTEASTFRKSFYDTILHIDKSLYRKIEDNIDDLITKLTSEIGEHDFTNVELYDRFIANHINHSKTTLIALLYNFKGISESYPAINKNKIDKANIKQTRTQ